MFNKLLKLFQSKIDNKPLTDLSLGYDRIDEFKNYLITENYVQFEEEYEELEWDAKTLMNEGIGLDASYADHIQKWVNQNPSYISFLFAGVSKTCLAWIARSSGVGSSLSNKQGEQFIELLNEAFQYLEEADNLNPEDAEICARTIRVCMGLSVEEEITHSYFAASKELVPNHLMSHLMMINYFTPKWYGSIDKMHEFANREYEEREAAC